MFWALAIIVGCGTGSGTETEVSPQRAAATADTLRNCLKIAGGLHSQDKLDAAVDQVYGCYEGHFAPMEPLLRAQNRRATLSLEYGFGRLAVNMGKRRGDPAGEAEQLSDRVESVIASVQPTNAGLPATPATP